MRRAFRTLLALSAASFVVTAASAQAPATNAAPVRALVERVDIPHETFTLANGLRVVVHTDRKAPIVAVSVWYGVGSADEPRGKGGFAHLFEHLMYNGSGNFDGEFFEPLEDVGATNYNGTTSFDRTNYFENVPTPALDLALFLEADRMGNLLPAVTLAKIDNQRGVVQNEKRQGDNQPYGLAFYSILEGLFPEGHPYRRSPIGTMADLDAASLADVKTWFQTHYGPNNAVLVLAGDIDAKTARPMVERRFGKIARAPAPPPPAAPVPRLAQIKRETMTDRVAATRLYFGWPTPGRLDPASQQISVATTILAGGASSRLHNDLVREKQLATSVGGFVLNETLASGALLFVDVKPGQAAAAEARVDAILAEFIKSGPTADEVARVATRGVSGTIRGLEQVGGFGGKAVALAEGTLYANDPAFYKTELARFANATPKSVQAAAREWMSRPSYRLTINPGERGAAELARVGTAAAPAAATPAQPAGARDADRSKLPKVTGYPDLEFPAVERGKLSNGVEVVFARRAAVPVVEVMASFDAGNAADPKAKLGTQSLMLALLREGTASRTGPQIVEEAERLGASIGSSAGMDSARVSLSALAPNLDASLALFADVLRNPAFAPAEIERLRAIQLQRIAQEESVPQGVAVRTLPPLIYGADHPYAVPFTGSGTAAGVSAVSRADLLAFHRAWLRPDNMTLFVVGDATLANMLPRLERALGTWRPTRGTAKGVKRFTQAKASGGSRIIIIDRPGSPQSQILGGYALGVKGTDDPIALRTANQALGGIFTSRLNTDLRETKGWAYGANSSLNNVREQLPFFVSAPVQSDRTGDSIAAIIANVRDYTIGAKPITQSELARITNSNVLSLPGNFETSGSVLGALETIEIFERPDNYYTALAGRYRALDVAGVDSAAEKAIDPSKIVWIVVGDAKLIRPQLTALKLPVEVMAATPAK